MRWRQSHVSDEELLLLEDGELRPRRRLRVQGHLRTCRTCAERGRMLRETLEALTGACRDAGEPGPQAHRPRSRLLERMAEEAERPAGAGSRALWADLLQQRRTLAAAGLAAAGLMGDSPGFDRLGACVLIVAAACAIAAPASAQPAGQPAGNTARTAWGDPDLQGVWDFASNTPLNRPEAFGDRLLLTDEEAAERQQVRIAARDRQDNTPARAGSTGTYNRFWTDNPRETRQTSLVIDPPNGRVPALTPAA